MDLSIVISAIDKASGVFSKVGGNLEKTGAKMKSIGGSMTKMVSLPILGVGIAATKMGLDFSKGIEYANTMLKLSGGELKKFKSGVLDLSSKYGKSADDIAKAAYSVSSVLHTSGEDTVKILDSIAAGAKAGKISTEDAGNAMIRIMSIYGIKAGDTGKLVDTLSATVKAGNANWADLAEILPNVAGLAKPLGVNLNEIAGAFAATSAKAGSSAEAGTALRGVLTGLIKPSEEMKEAIKDMGFENSQAAIKSIGLKGVLEKLGEQYGGNAEAIGELFPNIRGITGATALFANGGKDLAEAMDTVKNSMGETQKQIEAGQGPAENFADAMNKLKIVGIELFETMSPYISKAVKWIGDLADKFKNLSPKVKKMIVIGMALAAALGPVLMFVGAILMALPGLGIAFSALCGPVGIVIAAITALIAIGTALYLNWDKIKGYLSDTWEGIKYLALTNFEAIRSKIASVMEWIEEKISWLLDKVDRVKGAVGGIGEKVGGAFSSAGSWLSSKIPSFQEGGIVPGIGPQLAVVHGGEAISPRGAGNINIYIQGGNYLDREAGEKFAEVLGKMLRKELRY